MNEIEFDDNDENSTPSRKNEDIVGVDSENLNLDELADAVIDAELM